MTTTKLRIKAENGLVMDVTKLERGSDVYDTPTLYANAITYFDPFDYMDLLSAIKNISSVEKIGSTASYGEGIGGISLQLRAKTEFESFILDLERCLNEQQRKQ